MESEIRLWVVGTVGIDTITTRQGRFENQLGGSVTYAGAGASFFTRVGSVGVVGSDFPDAFMERYLKLGMDVAGIQFEKGKTFHWEGIYEADMVNRRTVRTDLGVLENFAPQLPASYRGAPLCCWATLIPTCSSTCWNRPRARVSWRSTAWISGSTAHERR